MSKQDKGAPAATVGAYIANQPPEQRATLERLRALVREEAPQAEEDIKWGVPLYAQGGYLCALMRHKGYVRLQFSRGVDLDDPNNLLEGTGKGMRHLKIHDQRDLPEPQVRRWLCQAVRLNATPAP